MFVSFFLCLMRKPYHEVNVQIFLMHSWFHCKNESYLVEQEMAVQIVTFYQNENIIYTVFAYKTMYIKCMVRFFFLKRDIKREWYWELLLVSVGLFLLSCFKNMPILRSVMVRTEVITRKLRRKDIVLVLKHCFVMLQVCIFHTEVKVSMV